MPEICTEEDFKDRYYPYECQDCGHRGCSQELEWDGPPDGDVYCPLCGSEEIKDCENWREENES